MSSDLAARLEALDTKGLVRILAYIIATSVAVSASTIIAYGLWFGGSISKNQAIWAQFGEFVGGLLSPLLSLFALLAVVLTVILQARQLDYAREGIENSRKELAATLEQLQRSADAQARAASELATQAELATASARLSALSAALSVTRERIEQARGSLNSNYNDYQADVRRQKALQAKILQVTDKLCGNVAE